MCGDSWNNGYVYQQPDSITLSVDRTFPGKSVSTLVNWPLEKSFSGPFDTLSFCALFLCLYHGGYTGKQIQAIALVMLAGVLTGLLFGLSEYSSGISSSLSFHSAGVTTQSSIYLGIAIMTAYGFQADATDNPGLLLHYVYISLFMMGVALLYMGSRGAIFAVFILHFLVLALNRSKRLYIISRYLITAVICASLFPDKHLSDKYQLTGI